MSALIKINAIRHSLTNNEAQIAEYLLAKPQSVKDLSSQKLAEAIGVSQSSIVKFTQKLGYKGYPALKLALVESLNAAQSDVQLHGKITLNDDLPALSEKLLASKTSVLNETSKLNDAEVIEVAVQKLLNANRILVAGVGASGLVATDFSYKLQKVGKAANSEPSAHVQLAYVSSFGEGDLVVCISESGNTKDVVAVAELAREVGADVITITSYGKNALIKQSSINLYTVAEQSSIRLSSILSRTSQEFVIDMLFIALTQTSADCRASVGKSNQAVKGFVK